MEHGSPRSAYALHKLASLIELRASQQLLYEFGISFSHFKVLAVLQEHDAIQQKTIADYLGQTEASISRLVVDLEKHGFIDRFRDMFNRRQNIVRLTTHGAQLASEAAERVDALLVESFSVLSEEEQQHFIAYAERILSKM